MYKRLIIFLLLIFVGSIPFVFKQKGANLMERVDEKLIILTAHNEAIRYEFAAGFKEWYYQKTGKVVGIDWRTPGSGSQEMLQYVDAMYTNAFKLYWERELGRVWSHQVQEAFVRRGDLIKEGTPPLVKEVREAFDASQASSGLDLFFGGGKQDVVMQAKKGQLLPLDIFKTHPEWFTDSSIPHIVGGNDLWDKDYRWVGNAISGFGIIYNKDGLSQLHIKQEPRQWVDLTSSALVGEVAVADPVGSGTFTVAFEFILQQQMQEVLKDLLQEWYPENQETVSKAVSLGWLEGMKIIQKISANARYFTDAATKPVLDVAAGDCVAGMAIDFYGLFQEENLRKRSGSDRFVFVMPKGGSAISPDTISMFKGALHPEVASAFVEYVLSLEGQKLWAFKVGAPGGPKIYALNRAPIRKELYEEQYLKYRNNPEINLYRDVSDFVYHPEWTAHLFRELRFVIKAAFIDPHKDLVAAWKGIIKAQKEGRYRDADNALAEMSHLDSISYYEVNHSIKDVLYSGDSLDAVRLQSNFTRLFRKQYEQASKLAKGEVVTP